MNDDEKPPTEFPIQLAQGQGSGLGYSVEARYMNRDTSTIVAGRAFGPRWERVPFDKARIGVPSIPPVHVAGSLFDSALSYAAAQALRWWFLAEAARDCSDLCLETRLVEHRCKFTWEEVQIRALNETDGFNRLPKAVGDG